LSDLVKKRIEKINSEINKEDKKEKEIIKFETNIIFIDI